MNGTTTSENPLEADAEAAKVDLQKIADAWPEIEALIESSGRNQELDEQLLEYVKEIRREDRQIRWIRILSLILFATLIASLWWHLLDLILGNWFSFSLIGSNARVALIAGVSAITALFMAVLMRGIFRVADDRNKHQLPEHIKQLAKITDSISD